MKKCSKCKIEKDKSEFYRSSKEKDGLTYVCKNCTKERIAEIRQAKGIKKKEARFFDENEQECACCRRILPLNLFCNNKQSKNGKHCYCNECNSRKSCESREKDPFIREKRRIKYEKTKETRRMQNRRAKLIRIINELETNDYTINPSLLKTIYSCEYCYYCNKYISENIRTIDHVTPLIQGGEHSIYNIVMSCRNCNSRKHDKNQSEYIDYCKRRNIICFPYWDENISDNQRFA